MVIGIDFDGTIVEDKFPLIGDVKPGAEDVIEDILLSGHEVVIWTCRDFGVIKKFLDKEQWGFANRLYINENPRSLRETYGNDPRKLGVDMFIDDKNIFTQEVNWDDIRTELEQLKIIK